MSASSSPVSGLQTLWARLSPLPGGRRIFSFVLGWMVPYSGTMGAVVTDLEPGYARIELRERRRVRNHLRSVHAMALANLGELTTGLAMVGALPQTARGIVTGFEIRYHKKARGRLVAECRCAVPEVVDSREHSAHARIVDEAGDEVASVTAKWLLGPAIAKEQVRS